MNKLTTFAVTAIAGFAVVTAAGTADAQTACRRGPVDGTVTICPQATPRTASRPPLGRSAVKVPAPTEPAPIERRAVKVPVRH